MELSLPPALHRLTFCFTFAPLSLLNNPSLPAQVKQFLTKKFSLLVRLMLNAIELI